MISEMHDAATAAFNSLSSEGGDNAATETAVETHVESAAPVVADAQKPDAPASGETPEPSEGRVRGPDGRFTKSATNGTPAPKQEAKDATKPAQEATPTETAKPKEGATDLTRPPPGLGPLARAKWDATPTEVREDLWRREKETAQALRTSAEARQFHENWTKTISPYEQLFRSEGVDPQTGTQNLLQAMSVLHAGPPMHKAAMVARIIQNYGVDPGAVAQVLGGEAGPAQPQQDERLYSQLQQLQQELSELKSTREQGAREYASNFVAEFSKTHEFFEDVRPHMAKLVQAGYEPETAYEMAVQADPRTREAFRRKQLEAADSQRRQELEQKKAASISVRSAPVVAPRAPAGEDYYSQAAAAYDELISG